MAARAVHTIFRSAGTLRSHFAPGLRRPLSVSAPDSPATDYYGDLGLEKECSTEDVKAAYRRIALLHHPDSTAVSGSEGDAEALFLRATEAYEVLSNSEKRAKYDEALNRQRRTQNPNAGGRARENREWNGESTFTPNVKPAGGYKPFQMDFNLSRRDSPAHAEYMARRKTGRAKSVDVQSASDAAKVPMATISALCAVACTFMFLPSNF